MESTDHLIAGARWIEFEKYADSTGSLTPIEGEHHVPFAIKRVFYFYDVPIGESRGSHAHRAQEQVIVCLAGSFDVILDCGSRQQQVHVSRPWRGLYVPPLLWTSQINFDGGTLGLVLSSEVFDEADYIRSYDEYRSLMIAK